MNVSRSFISRTKGWVAGALLTSTMTAPASAEDVTITAVFKPDSAYPHLNKFKNTTPPSGYCGNWPDQCELEQFFSLKVPIQFNSRSPIQANHASVRQGAMLKAPAQWRELTVYHETTREPETVRVRISTGVSRQLGKLEPAATGCHFTVLRLAFSPAKKWPRCSWGTNWLKNR